MRGRAIFLCALLFLAFSLRAQQNTSSISTVDGLVRAGIANNKDLAAVQERIAEARWLTRQAGVRPSTSGYGRYWRASDLNAVDASRPSDPLPMDRTAARGK
jgi:hypothetical protein